MAPALTWARRLALLPLAAMLAACELLPDWIGDAEDPPLPGERISVLSLQDTLEPDPRIADLEVRLPRPWRNPDWPQAGGFPNHAMHHLELPDDLATAWEVSVGEGSSSLLRLLAPPIVAGGRVFVMDAESRISAIDANTGERLWRANATPKGEDDGALGGGLALDGGVLFVSTGYGDVYALEAETGRVYWERRVGVPMRAPPTAADGRVFVVTYDNQMFALAADDGRVLWNHVGIPEDAGLIGGAAPAVDGDIVVVPYTSGELFALRVENGRVVWSDQLVKAARFTPLAALSDIRGKPVVDRGRVIAISHSGRMAAIDLRTGERIWDRDITGVETPWVSGDFIYVVTTQAELLCLSRRDGRIRWVAQLQRFEDEEDREDPIQWSGPVLVSDRLVLVSSHGRAVSVSPYSGEVLGEMNLPAASFIAPVVADGTLYILSDDAELIALR